MTNEMEYEEFEVETLSIPMDDGTDVECAILDQFEVNGETYMALAPIEDDIISEEIWIYGYSEDGDDIELRYLDDAEELKMVSEAYDRLLAEDEEE